MMGTHIYIERDEWLQQTEELAHLRAENERLKAALAEVADLVSAANFSKSRYPLYHDAAPEE